MASGSPRWATAIAFNKVTVGLEPVATPWFLDLDAAFADEFYDRDDEQDEDGDDEQNEGVELLTHKHARSPSAVVISWGFAVTCTRDDSSTNGDCFWQGVDDLGAVTAACACVAASTAAVLFALLARKPVVAVKFAFIATLAVVAVCAGTTAAVAAQTAGRDAKSSVTLQWPIIVFIGTAVANLLLGIAATRFIRIGARPEETMRVV